MMMQQQKVDKDNQSIYCYENTSLLINHMNIKDKNALEKIENMLVTYKLATLIDDHHPFKRDLTVNHYLKIHEYLFADLYPFGGKIREEFINKKNSDEISDEEGIRIYCSPNLIYEKLNEQLISMKKQAISIYTKENLIDFLANNYLELYFIHPFREGNSRTLREFLREYVEIMNKLLFTFGNFSLEYSYLTQFDNKNFIRATMWNISSDKEKQKISIELLKEIFDKCLIEYELKDKKTL
ncbi:MAG: Fic family protein [Bacilli bacterium]|nr:Fic family protein [Bacilli bacterium]